MLLAGHFEPVALTTKAFLRSFFCLEAHPNLGSFILKSWSNFLTSRQSITTLGKPSLLRRGSYNNVFIYNGSRYAKTIYVIVSLTKATIICNVGLHLSVLVGR